MYVPFYTVSYRTDRPIPGGYLLQVPRVIDQSQTAPLHLSRPVRIPQLTLSLHFLLLLPVSPSSSFVFFPNCFLSFSLLFSSTFLFFSHSFFLFRTLFCFLLLNRISLSFPSLPFSFLILPPSPSLVHQLLIHSFS